MTATLDRLDRKLPIPISAISLALGSAATSPMEAAYGSSTHSRSLTGPSISDNYLALTLQTASATAITRSSCSRLPPNTIDPFAVNVAWKSISSDFRASA
jgi:hypothetical protein